MSAPDLTPDPQGAGLGQRLLRVAQAAWQKWRAFALKMAYYQSLVLLTVVYFSVLGLVALVARVVGRSFLPSTYGRAESHWLPREPIDPSDVKAFTRQF